MQTNPETLAVSLMGIAAVGVALALLHQFVCLAVFGIFLITIAELVDLVSRDHPQPLPSDPFTRGKAETSDREI